jgi:hypothetical protein
MIHVLDNISIKGLNQAISLGEKSSRLYKKQVAYVGQFGQYDHKTGKLVSEPVKITKEEIDHWVRSVKEQAADGVAIPMQKTHNPTTSVDEAYGNVIDAVAEADDKGRYSMYFICEFGDEKKAEVANVADCSIYQPPSYVNGVGKLYTRPVRHLMLTTAPTIPDMGKFVALSLIPESATMNEFLVNLAKSLGITVAADATDASLSALISSAYAAVNASVADLTAKVTDLTTKLTESASTVSALKAASVALSLPPVVVSTTQNIRKARLDALVGKQITPAMRDSLVATFAKPSGVVSLSLSEDQTSVTDEVFDGVVVALSQMPDMGLLGKKLPNQGNPKSEGGITSMEDFIKAQAKKE